MGGDKARGGVSGYRGRGSGGLRGWKWAGPGRHGAGPSGCGRGGACGGGGATLTTTVSAPMTMVGVSGSSWGWGGVTSFPVRNTGQATPPSPETTPTSQQARL
jgi:hypothetical protein